MSFKPDISVDVCGKHFKNPVIAAFGTRRYFLQGYDLK